MEDWRKPPVVFWMPLNLVVAPFCSLIWCEVARHGLPFSSRPWCLRARHTLAVARFSTSRSGNPVPELKTLSLGLFPSHRLQQQSCFIVCCHKVLLFLTCEHITDTPFGISAQSPAASCLVTNALSSVDSGFCGPHVRANQHCTAECCQS